MDIVNKVLILAVILITLAFIPSLAQPSGGIDITHLDVSHDMVSYEGFVEIENTGNKNINYALIVVVDEKTVVAESIRWLGHKYRSDHGMKMQVRAWSRTYFPVIETGGNHTIMATVLNGIWPVAVAETTYYVEEAVKECGDCIIEKEDWLGCP